MQDGRLRPGFLLHHSRLAQQLRHRQRNILLINLTTMSAAIGKFFNPATYSKAFASVGPRAQARYHANMRDNGADFLWHMMFGVSLVMYTGTFVSRKYPLVQEKREQERVAMKEYYEKHGGGDHH